MIVGQLKRMFPKATYRLVKMEDIPSAVVMVSVSQCSEILFYFVSSADTAKPPADKDTINFMMTKNPRYATAADIRPSTVSIWGQNFLIFRLLLIGNALLIIKFER
jgi:hypothetical protein